MDRDNFACPLQLKILACNISGGTLSGAINLNGRPLVVKELRKQSTIVWQRDLLLPTATVQCSRLHTYEMQSPFEPLQCPCMQ